MGLSAPTPSTPLEIIKASEIKPFDSRLFMISGNPGSGKTTSLLTLPLVEKEEKTNNCLLFSFDGKYSVLSGCPNIDIADLYIDPSAENYLDIFAKVQSLLKQIKDKTLVYPFICLDPLGLIQKLYERRSHDAYPKGGWDRVNFLKDEVWKLISGCLTSGAKVILILHEEAERSELGILQFSHAAFGSLMYDLPVQFHEVWRAYTSGEGKDRKFQWQTAAQGFYPKCATRIKGLPLTIQQDFTLVLTTEWWKKES